MTLESWNTSFQLASAVLLGLTFVVGAGAIFTSYRIGERQQRLIAELARDAATANLAAAEANAKAAALNDRAARAELQLAEVQRRQSPRKLDVDAVAGALRDLPARAAVVVWAEEVTAEAYWFSQQVRRALEEGGWKVRHQAMSGGVNEWEYVAGASRDALRDSWLDDRRPEGIQLLFDEKAPAEVLAHVKGAFRRGGVGIGVGKAYLLNDGELLQVMVGLKP